MKFSFHSSCNPQSCQILLNAISGRLLATGKIFDGEIKENTFFFNYTLPYRDHSSAIHQTKKLPHCSVSGRITKEGRGSIIDGSVTIVKGRVLIISVIFIVALIPVALFLHSKNVPFNILLYIIMAYVLFFVVEFFRYYNTRKEALEEFKKLLL